MKTRRSFLELSAKLAAVGLRAGARGAWAGRRRHHVRRADVHGAGCAEKDLAAAFALIKHAGFNQVELYPIAYHQPAAQLRKLLADTGLTAVSGHFDYTGRPTSVEYAHGLGLKYLVCPMLPEDQKLTLDGFAGGRLLQQWGEEAKKAGCNSCFTIMIMSSSRSTGRTAGRC